MYSVNVFNSFLVLFRLITLTLAKILARGEGSPANKLASYSQLVQRNSALRCRGSTAHPNC